MSFWSNYMNSWSGGSCTGGICMNILLFLTATGFFLNLARVNFTGFKKFDMSATNHLSAVEKITARYGQSLEISRSSEMVELAKKLDEAFRKIKNPQKAFQGNPKAAKVLVDAHQRLKKMTGDQRGFFNSAWRDVGWAADAINIAKSQGKDKTQCGVEALGTVTRKMLASEMKEFEKLIQGLLNMILSKVWGSEHAKTAKGIPKYTKAVRMLTAVRHRLLGWIAEEFPSILRKAITHPGVVPVLQEILLDNPYEVAEQKEGKVMISIAKFLPTSVFGQKVDIKAQVKRGVENLLPRAVQEAKDILMAHCAKWKKEGRKYDKVLLAREENWGDLKRFWPDKNLMKRVNRSIKKSKTKAKDVEDSHDHDDTVGRGDLEAAILHLQNKVVVLWCFVVALAILLLLSWAYIALTIFYFDHEDDKPRKSIDLELGEGPRRSINVSKGRKSRRSRRSRTRKSRSRSWSARPSKSSVRHSRASMRHSICDSHLQVMVNSGRGKIHRSRSRGSVSKNAESSRDRSGRGRRSSRSRHPEVSRSSRSGRY